VSKNTFVSIGLVQTSVSNDPNLNLREALNLVEQAAEKGAQIISLPELYRSIYFAQYFEMDKNKFAETIPGESTMSFSRIAKKYNVFIIIPLYEKSSDGKFYNSAVVINSNGEVMDTYRKIHIPQDPCYYEKEYFDQDEGIFKVFKTEFCNFSVLICYDQWFPEAARIVTLKGADLIFYPTAIGTIDGNDCKDGDWCNAWETVMRGHAIANGIHVAAINRTGVEGKIKFWGSSFICDAFGKILNKAEDSKPQIIIQEIDLTHNALIRDGWGFLKNRRPDTYKQLIK